VWIFVGLLSVLPDFTQPDFTQLDFTQPDFLFSEGKSGRVKTQN
tara:strand:+ start:417 stop:548 length:132 start_codon:yes stop_codon:yes gene_type:complete